MNIEIKDEILTGEPRYRIRDNNGNIIQDNVAIEKTTPVKQEATPINKKLFQDLYNDISPKGIIKSFSSIKDREGYLLCDGGTVYKSDYPELYKEITTYDIFKIVTAVEINPTGGTGFEGAIAEANNVFFIATRYGSNDRSHVWYSHDGYLWGKCVSTMPDGNDVLVGALYVNGVYYIFVVYNKMPSVFYGADLNNLTQAIIYNTSLQYLNSFAYNNGVFSVIVGDTSNEGSGNRKILYSTDGIKWSEAIVNGTTGRYVSLKMGKHFVINNIFYFTAIYGGNEYRRYESTDGINWTYTVITQEQYVTAKDSVYNNYVWRMTGNILQRTNNLQSWENYKTYDKDFTGATITIDRNGVFYLTGASEPNIFAYSTDLEEFITDITRETTPSSDLVANNKVTLTVAGYSIYAFYLDGSEAKMVLPTLKDKTNQIYGYIQVEGA